MSNEYTPRLSFFMLLWVILKMIKCASDINEFKDKEIDNS